MYTLSENTMSPQPLTQAHQRRPHERTRKHSTRTHSEKQKESALSPSTSPGCKTCRAQGGLPTSFRCSPARALSPPPASLTPVCVCVCVCQVHCIHMTWFMGYSHFTYIHATTHTHHTVFDTLTLMQTHPQNNAHHAITLTLTQHRRHRHTE